MVSSLLDRFFPWLIKPEIHTYPLKVCRYARQEDYIEHSKELFQFAENSEDREFEGIVIKAKVIPAGKGSHKWIDIVHREGGKSAGVIYAQEFFRIPPQRTLVAGDAENDIDMFKGEELGVVVSNFESELRDFVITQHAPNKFISTHAYADAIVDGIGRLTRNLSSH